MMYAYIMCKFNNESVVLDCLEKITFNKLVCIVGTFRRVRRKVINNIVQTLNLNFLFYLFTSLHYVCVPSSRSGGVKLV